MRLQRLGLLGVILLGFGMGRAEAQTTYDACYVPAVGAIYLIKQAGLPTACLAQGHVAFSWTSGGTVADGSITPAKLAFDPATQVELNAVLSQLAAIGTINTSANPVDWTQLKSVPAGLADGVDDGGGTASDLVCASCVAASDLANNAVTTAKIANAAVTSAKLDFDPATQAEQDAVTAGLAAAGTVNSTTNPVDWTQLKNVPAGFADGVDAGGTGTSDHGALTGLADDDHSHYLLTDGVRNATNGFAVTGTFGTGTIPATGTGVRLMWYPRKGAFRAGVAFGTSWADASIGDYSIAMGASPIASGSYSTALGGGANASGAATTALGYLAVASGDSATALGVRTTASGIASKAMGVQSQAIGEYSTAMGFLSTASGNHSTAMGPSTAATSHSSTAMGQGTRATSFSSTAMGDQTIASAPYSTAMGYSSEASGEASAAMGWFTTARAYGSLVIGRFNAIAGDQSAWIATDPLFVAGNGNSTAAPFNALTLLKNGNMTIAGTLTQSSDIRFKEGIRAMDRALDGVLDLRPIYYRFREGTGHPTDEQIGLAAQEVEQIFPQLVHRDSEGKLSVAYTQLAAVLVRAMQEQQQMIEALRAEVAALRATQQR